MKPIIETTRLQLREFNLNDAKFILLLLNTPTWLEFIGDKQVKNLDDASQYINSHLLQSYKANGYGLWLVELKDSNMPIGMCGLVKRESLEHTDIGFAFLPEFEGQGYGFESANAVMNYAKYSLKLDTILAITDVKNQSSIRLLEKIGLNFKYSKELSKNDKVLIFSSKEEKTEKCKLNNLVQKFFEVFTNTNGRVPNLNILKDIMIPEATIINNTTEVSEIYTLDGFITPRKKLLTGGTLTDFQEYEVSNTTEIYNNTAHRFSLYYKGGKMNGETFETIGQKSFQFVKLNDNWKIASVIWFDSSSSIQTDQNK